MDHVASVRVDHDGPVGRIVLERPERHNAQTPRMWEELRAAADDLAARPDVRVVLLTGSGPSFSSGLDLDERREGGLLHQAATLAPAEATALIERLQKDFRRLSASPFPVVAAVHGNALGAGLQLALSADIRIVAEDAVLAVAELGLGVVPDLGATTDLPRLIGLERALDLILSARRFSGSEAVDMGLALRAVPAADLEAVALEYARRLAGAPRLALHRAKEATREPDPAASLAIAARGQVECVRAAMTSAGRAGPFAS